MTNAQILTAVLLKWAEPIIPVLTGTAISGYSSSLLPFERMLKNWGIVGNGWSISQELQSLVNLGGTKAVQPFLHNLIAKIPDDAIPSIAHEYVNGAIKAGSMPILDGKFTFDKDDLIELKKYLDCNLQYTETEEYQVIIPSDLKTPKPDGAGSGNSKTT